jgi:hypothetical protein
MRTRERAGARARGRESARARERAPARRGITCATRCAREARLSVTTTVVHAQLSAARLPASASRRRQLGLCSNRDRLVAAVRHVTGARGAADSTRCASADGATQFEALN